MRSSGGLVRAYSTAPVLCNSPARISYNLARPRIGRPRFLLHGSPSYMHVTINGEAKTLTRALTVTQLLADCGLDPHKVAVERNLEIVPRSGYDVELVNDGDRIEIVHFIGGGAPDIAPAPDPVVDDAPLVVAGRRYRSRLLVGTGNY